MSYYCKSCGSWIPYKDAQCSTCHYENRDHDRISRNNSSSRSTTYSTPSYRPDNFTGHKSQGFTDGSRYVGDFVNGKRHGKGTNYFADGAQYEGDFKNGYMNGYGVMVYADGEKYEGEWLDGKRHGQGVHWMANGDQYSGEWKNNRMDGYGLYTYANGNTYAGNYAEGRWNGVGTYTFANGNRVEGEFRDGKQHGRGKEIFTDGEIFEGIYANGKRCGYGVYHYSNGTRYEGQWENGQKQGKGTYYYSKAIYNGDWYADERHGYGVEEIYTDEGTQRYEGAFKFGKRDGYGKMICADSESYEGEYKEGKRHGKGRCVLPDGTVQDGYFENGDFIGNAPPKFTETNNVGMGMDISPDTFSQFKQTENMPATDSKPADEDTGMDISPDMLARFMQGGNIPQPQSASASRPQPEREIWLKLLPLTSEQRNDFLETHPDVIVPSGVAKIPDNMFKDCTNLRSIRFNQDLREIGTWAFNGCKNLGPDLVIPSGVERIRRFAFSNCSSIKKAILPNRITIEEAALMCSVTVVEFETNPPIGVVLEKGAFRYCNMTMSKEMQKKIKDLNPKAFK